MVTEDDNYEIHFPTEEENEQEYQALLKEIEEWEARGVKVPMAWDGNHKPIWDQNIPLGTTVWVPAFSQGWDRCRLLKDADGYYAKSKFGETYRLDFGPNWYVTSEL